MLGDTRTCEYSQKRIQNNGNLTADKQVEDRKQEMYLEWPNNIVLKYLTMATNNYPTQTFFVLLFCLAIHLAKSNLCPQ